jgi:Flp pilus assembly protein TadD
MRRVIVVVVLVLIAFFGTTWVGSGDLVVREVPGGAAILLTPGLHVRVPLYHRIYRYDTTPTVVDEPMAIVTRDSATFKLPCRISAHVAPGDVLTFHRGRSGRDTATYLGETVRNAIRDAAHGMNSDQVLAPGAGTRIGQQVSADLIARGISDDGLEMGAPGSQVIFNAVVDDLNRKFAASARQLVEASLKEHPNEALLHAALGAVLESEGKPADAEKQYLEALFLDPTALEPMSRLFLMYQTSHDPEALGRLQRLLAASLAKKSDSPVHQDWLGQVYMRQGQADKAETAFKAAITLAPKTSEFHVSLGSLRAQQNRLDDARAEYQEALTLRPESTLALYNMGVVEAMSGQIDKAIENFEHAARTAPPSVALLNAMAQAYEQKGDLAKAAAALRQSLQQRPNQPDRAAALKSIEARLRAKR